MKNSIDNLLAITKVDVISGKFFHCDKLWRQEKRVLPDSMWYWLKRGTCVCELEGKIYKFNPGDLFMIPAGCSHSVYPSKPHNVETVTVHFYSKCYSSGEITGMLSLGGVYSDKDNIFMQANDKIVNEFNKKLPGYLWKIEAYIKQVLIELIRQKVSKMPLSDSLLKLQQIGEVLHYVEMHLSSPIKIQTLASIAGVSEVYLRKLFRICNMPSPTNFIIQQRIFMACELLKNTTAPIKTIAIKCGFSDLPFFYKTFRKTTGRTPGNFRHFSDI